MEKISKAVVSISPNLAEGISHSSFKEKLRFTEIAYGSSIEVYCQYSRNSNYLSSERFEETAQLVNEITYMLNAL